MPSLESLVAPALAGDPSAVRALVGSFTPVIARHAARVLASRRDVRRRDPQEELEEIAQHVLLVLFKGDGRLLRAWQEEDGISLTEYVGRIAEREVGREGSLPLAAAVEPDIGSRDLFDHLHARLAEEHHPRAMEMYRLLVIEDVPIAEVCARTGLSADAVQAWRNRLLFRARQLLGELRALFLSDSAHHRAARARTLR